MILFDSHHRPSEHEVIVPPRLESKTALLEFLRVALRLPDYFGANWDALEECLGELAETGVEKFSVVHHDLPLEGDPAAQRTYLEIIGHAARESSRLDAVFPEILRERVTATLRKS